RSQEKERFLCYAVITAYHTDPTRIDLKVILIGELKPIFKIHPVPHNRCVSMWPEPS
ncbi:uncharacterized, partial [Tachysurus ichikawai]